MMLASNDASVILALVAIIGSTVTALLALLRANTRALNSLVDANQKIATATETGNREAKERNGHLGEQNVQITKIVEDNSELSREILNSVRGQRRE